MRSNGSTKEKRWAVIAADGRHAWLGRHSDPSDAELADVSQSLEQAGLAGWLAVTEGIYYEREHDMRAIPVRRLAGDADWETALAAFFARRAEALNGA